MNADEAEQFVRLLYRYAETELDQWDNWLLDTEVGPVYVSMSMALLPDWSPPRDTSKSSLARSKNSAGPRHPSLVAHRTAGRYRTRVKAAWVGAPRWRSRTAKTT
jgi:hypothetical protein